MIPANLLRGDGEGVVGPMGAPGMPGPAGLVLYFFISVTITCDNLCFEISLVNEVLMAIAVPKAPLDCPVCLVRRVLPDCKVLLVLVAFLASPVFQALQ